jgi:hypothetical protein
VKPGDDPVIGEAEREVRVFVERQHLENAFRQAFGTVEVRVLPGRS